MNNQEALIKRIGDLYLDLGVAIAELKKHNRQSPKANTGLQDRVEAKFKAAPNVIMNMHQLAAELGENAAAVGKALNRLHVSKKLLERVGSGTYVYKRKNAAGERSASPQLNTAKETCGGV